MNKKIEVKIDEWYPSVSNDGKDKTRWWLAKHYHRWITYGCPMCWIENCGCPPSRKNGIDIPKGFEKMSKYCYEIYWNHEN